VGDCGNTKHVTVVFTATDACSNSSTTSATFTIEDTTDPVIGTAAADQTVECDGAGNVAAFNAWLTGHAGSDASDVCGGAISWTNDYVVGNWVATVGTPDMLLLCLPLPMPAATALLPVPHLQ